MKLISLNRDNFESKKDWENICKTFHLSNETSEIYFYLKGAGAVQKLVEALDSNIITRTSKTLTWENKDETNL
tara:strand:- start:1130 stop:1348 length:219 start_codon:yes stop_codon:yes gene_type:complete